MKLTEPSTAKGLLLAPAIRIFLFISIGNFNSFARSRPMTGTAAPESGITSRLKEMRGRESVVKCIGKFNEASGAPSHSQILSSPRYLSSYSAARASWAPSESIARRAAPPRPPHPPLPGPRQPRPPQVGAERLGARSPVVGRTACSQAAFHLKYESKQVDL